jgi:preprotein translocase subunit SecD
MWTRRSAPTTLAVLLAVLLAALLTAGCLPGIDNTPSQTTRLTVSATTPTGTTPDQAATDSARDIVERRLTGAGHKSVKVTVPAAGQLSVSLAGRHTADELTGYLAPGDLSFRLVQDARQVPEATASPGTTDLSTLSARQQFDRPDVTCEALNARDAAAGFDPAQSLTACDAYGSSKYLLYPAAVRGTDVKDATATIDQLSSTWQVTLSFTTDGQQRWTDLSRKAVTNQNGSCGPNSVDQAGHCAVAIVVDGQVVSAPTILAVITGDGLINGGDINRATARQLASVLRSGRVPLTLRITSTEVTDR